MHILTFVGAVTTNKFETWDLISEACKGEKPVQIGQIPTDVLTPTRPSMMREKNRLEFGILQRTI